ncbi:MAG: hypothetical protein QOF58_6689 [Pseudonocardiales bacterium]|jgi:hypothetical protein|nr:hypothetical protein [Pseudonocardiales bacterium]
MSQVEVAHSGLFDDETFFLSLTNPTATVDQRELEAEAIELLDHPLVVQGRENAFMRFKVMASKYGANAPAEAFEGIEAKMQEWAFHYLLLGLNHDFNFPKVLNHGYGPPHKWLGMDVPGCRGLGTAENPDNNYCFIPIGYANRYELHGRISPESPIEDVNFWLTNNLSMSSNVAGLMWQDVVKSDDGTFVITIDSDPADGRDNHIRSTPDTQRLFIRDSRKDWGEIPNAYRIVRLGEPTAPPIDQETKLQMAKRFIIDDMATNFWFRMMVGYLEPNTITGPDNTGDIGGMITQKILRGRVDLESDEAFVLTTDPGGSDYWNIVAYDWWLMSMDFWDHTSSLNNFQSVANDDGSYTHVFARQDPGVHNWIDVEGLHYSLFLLRWQQLPQAAAEGAADRWIAAGEPQAECKLVKLVDLKDALPPETRWVTEDQRRDEIASRLAQFNRRHEV